MLEALLVDALDVDEAKTAADRYLSGAGEVDEDAAAAWRRQMFGGR